MIRKFALLSASAFVLATGVAAAQDYTLQPNYGQITLNNGFTPDPHTVAVRSGGTIDASALGSNCRGYVSNAPDYRLTYTAGSWPLIISVVSQSDTTLVINGPDAQWYCDDDGAGYPNPMYRWDTPQSGQYDIWIGTYGAAGTYNDATLYISELAAGTPAPSPTPNPTPTPAGGTLDYTLPANYGGVDLVTGFTPDPHTVDIRSGGSINAQTAVTTADCRGYVTSAPDYEVRYTAGTTYPLIFSVLSQSDTTLVINDPSGTWYCNDDSDGLNPKIRFDSPLSGTYDVWVGTYGSATTQPATLRVSELN